MTSRINLGEYLITTHAKTQNGIVKLLLNKICTMLMCIADRHACTPFPQHLLLQLLKGNY